MISGYSVETIEALLDRHTDLVEAAVIAESNGGDPDRADILQCEEEILDAAEAACQITDDAAYEVGLQLIAAQMEILTLKATASRKAQFIAYARGQWCAKVRNRRSAVIKRMIQD